MKSIARRALMLLGLGLAAWLPFKAAAGPEKTIELEMVMSLGGLTAGTIDLSLDFAEEVAISKLRLKSSGLIKMMTGYSSRSEATTALHDGALPQPVSFDSSYETRKHDRKVVIRYAAESGTITELQTWKRGKPQSSDVPEELRSETIDPLTAVLRLRHWLLALRGSTTVDSQAFEVFDGRRRYALNADLIERTTVKHDDERLPVFRLKVHLVPKAGFSSGDMLANWADEGEESWIELFVTDDANPVPLFIRTVGGTLESTIKLQKMCEGAGECRKFES